jgi:hypothetical protein
MNPVILKGELNSIWHHCIQCQECRAKLFEIVEHLDQETEADIKELENKISAPNQIVRMNW